MLRTWLLRFGGLFNRQRRDRDLAAELESHLEMHIEDNLRAGMTPQEARRQALIKLGGLEQTKEKYRDRRSFPKLESFLQDLRFALRTLRKNPGFTAVAVLTLALGIGANTAIFSVIYGTLLRSLPFPEPYRIVELAEIYKGNTTQMSVTATQLLRLRDFGRPFEAISGYTDTDFNVTIGNAAEHVRAMPVSADFLNVLGERPEAGRNFRAEEDFGTGEPVVLVSHALSMRHFGNASAALGHTISLSGKPYTVIGVMPARFAADLGTLDGGPPWDLWIPLACVAKTVGSGENISVLARVKRGVTWTEVSAETEFAKADFHKEFPGDSGDSDNMNFIPLAKLVGAEIQPYLMVLFGATGLVLLIACANVSNLFLVRESVRRRELAVRMAMGASRMRLLRQLLTESMMITLVGGGLGVVVARLSVAVLLTMAPAAEAMGATGLPRINDIRLDGATVAFALVTSFVTGVFFGSFTALYAGKADVNQELREGNAGVGFGRSRSWLRQGLVSAELALSLVLLTGAGLMIATCAKLLNTSLGFDPRHVLAMEFWLGGSTYDTAPKMAEYFREIEGKVSSLPGVEAVGVVGAGLPLERGGNNPVRIAGQNTSVRRPSNYREASPGYFGAMGLGIREGRGISETDTATSDQVVVINEAFAKAYFPGRNPLGEHVYVAEVPCVVVGVVADAKSYLEEPATPTTFVPTAQANYPVSMLFEGWFPRRLVVRTFADPLALSRSVREAATSIDSSVPTGAILSMEQMVSRQVALREFVMFLLSLFSGLALILTSVGVYGVTSYTVALRTREIGVRMALGARPVDVLRMIVTQGLRIALAGWIIGIAAAALLTKLLHRMLFGVSMRDPLVFVLGTTILILVSLAACYIPARRAMRVDPMVALRHE